MPLPEYEDDYVYYIKRTTKSVKSRFWKKVDVRGENDCWIWLGYVDNLGYGKMGTIQGKTGFAHRISWELFHGKRIPDTMVICHRCDNTSCVNPNHLFLGTVADNNLDRHLKGRTKSPSNKGEGNPAAVLTRKSVSEIREYLKNKTLSVREISIKYGIATNTVYGLKNKRNWKDV